jgi:hypothetical protein
MGSTSFGKRPIQVKPMLDSGLAQFTILISFVAFFAIAFTSIGVTAPFQEWL